VSDTQMEKVVSARLPCARGVLCTSLVPNRSVSVFKIIWIPRAVCAMTVLLGLGGRADAQEVDLTFFVGRAVGVTFRF